MCIYIYFHWLKRPVGKYPDERRRHVFTLAFPMLIWESQTRENITESQSNKTLVLERAMEMYSSYTWAYKLFLVSELLFPTKNYTWKFNVKKDENLSLSPLSSLPLHSLCPFLLLSLSSSLLSSTEAPPLKPMTILAGLSNKPSSSKGLRLFTGA